MSTSFVAYAQAGCLIFDAHLCLYLVATVAHVFEVVVEACALGYGSEA